MTARLRRSFMPKIASGGHGFRSENMAHHRNNEEHDPSSRTTTEISAIMRRTLERGGPPAVVHRDGETVPILRLDFGEKEPSLKHISWDEFKDIFESNKLEFLYQEHVKSGQTSRFCEFISR
jgi:hypothetical protein